MFSQGVRIRTLRTLYMITPLSGTHRRNGVFEAAASGLTSAISL